ncbi:hypothetical protein [Chromobacterium sphagni]|uniref:Uncharacterized protein n=1 Tax=Chromobacterium sphagni TaxID=1903179 RepID=A0ABX3C9X5_9NEIS|nr:hypothetical protein [Chromobacterium sphagni]OHX18944.1 hypothetical protein BI344_09970 [Chromobacterium sphagni]
MNAAKKIRLLLEQSVDRQQTEVLLQLVANLQLGVPFDLRRLFQIEPQYFELGMALLRDWRFDHHIAARSKLFEEILARDAQLQRQLCQLELPALH